jgi:hypothetical protein
MKIGNAALGKNLESGGRNFVKCDVLKKISTF